jgi:aminoglycoside 3-N-acetyltransferase I
MPLVIHHLAPDDIQSMEALSAMFGEAFDDPETYTGKRPSADYLRRLLGGDSFIALVAMKNGNVVGGITAYELRKFEREHSEINLYGVGENSRPHSPIRCSQSTPPRDVMP